MILRNRSPQFFKCKKKKLKHMVLRSSADYNHKKHEENYTNHIKNHNGL